ncbi:hypothetical protein BVC80_1493g4 [Macleaya cordata]|uniref:Zinc finger protein n=1 Tax=Macleaya cordata TaxID=56857 RepID=A0A200QIN0_MACCD|nr:hypothetical protein BVC80_1493g4 [Macleaya cordata]
MGGGKASSQVSCQACSREGHDSVDCLWVYIKCRKPSCNGIRKLLRSSQPTSLSKKFFTCHHPTCNRFQWFEEAFNGVSSSSTQHPYGDGCFGCGATDHWIKACPWRDTQCTEPNCKGMRKLKISGTEHNYGISYLKCLECDTCEWLSDVLVASKAKEL